VLFDLDDSMAKTVNCEPRSVNKTNTLVRPPAATSFDSRKEAQKAQKKKTSMSQKSMPSPGCSFASFASFYGHSNDTGNTDNCCVQSLKVR